MPKVSHLVKAGTRIQTKPAWFQSLLVPKKTPVPFPRGFGVRVSAWGPGIQIFNILFPQEYKLLTYNFPQPPDDSNARGSQTTL